MPDLSDKVSDIHRLLARIMENSGSSSLSSHLANEASNKLAQLEIDITQPPASSMEGWRLVPEEPTDEQIAVGLESLAESTQEPMMHIVRDALFCYRRMVRSAPIPPPMEGWRTMDSAPKDGTSVLVWMLDEHSTEPSKYAVAWWGNHTWTRGGDDYDLVIEPTHWQPLPIPPEVMK